MISTKPHSRALLYGILGATLLLFLARQLATVRMGLEFDEGDVVYTPLRVIQGQVPYKDFVWVYGPLSLYINAWAYQLFGAGIEVIRIANVAAATIGVAVVFAIAIRLMPPMWAAAAGVVSLSLLRFPQYNYSHIYTVVAGFVVLLGMAMYMDRKQRRWLAMAGLANGLALMGKPSMGAAILATVGLFVLLARLRIRDMVCFYGSALILLVVPVYTALIVAGAPLTALLGSILPASGGLKDATYYGAVPSPLDFIPTSLSHQAIKNAYESMLFYLPILTSSAAVFMVLLRRELSSPRGRLVLLLSIYSLLIATQIYVLRARHGSGGYEFQLPTSLVLMTYLVWSLAEGLRARLSSHIPAVLGLMLLTAFFLFNFIPYYYLTPAEFAATIRLERADGVRTYANRKETLEAMIGAVENLSSPADVVATLPVDGLLYFLAKRDNPFPYDAEHWYEFTGAGTKEDQIAAFQRISAKLVIVKGDPEVAAARDPRYQYVLENYERGPRFGLQYGPNVTFSYSFFLRRD